MIDTSFRESQVGLSLQLTARVWRKKADAAAAQVGLSEATSWVLFNLMRLGDGTHLTALADAMNMEGPSVSRLVDNLVTLGLVDRRDDVNDRRAKMLCLTEAGRRVSDRLGQFLGDVREHLLKDVSQDDLDAVLRVCRSIQDRARLSFALVDTEDLR
jgi:MarR family transcriptional regulator for hemolysin